MLQAFRDRAMGVLGWVVIGLIIITFALFGLGSYLQDQSRVYAAKVNGVEIPLRDVQTAYQNQRARLEQMLGDAFDPAMIDEKQLKERALDGLIQRELILQAAHEEKMAISDQLLAAHIQSIAAFQEDEAASFITMSDAASIASQPYSRCTWRYKKSYSVLNRHRQC